MSERLTDAEEAAIFGCTHEEEVRDAINKVLTDRLADATDLVEGLNVEEWADRAEKAHAAYRKAEAERDYHRARADILLAKLSGGVALRGRKPGDYWAEWHRDHCAAAEGAGRERQRAEKAEAERDRLAAVVERVEALHKPIRVYDECEHDADHGCEPIEVYDYMGCSESVIGWGCSVCCYDDEYPREDCPHGADHRGIAEADSCPTHTALSDAGRGK